MTHGPTQRRRQNRLRHPDVFVDFFINIDPEPVQVLQGWRRLALPSDAKTQAIIALQEANLGLRTRAEAVAALEAAYDQKSHVDLHILLLLSWGRLLLFEETQGPLPAIVANQIASLISKRTPAEIVTWASYHEAQVKFRAGDVLTFERLVGQALADLPPTSAHYRRFKLMQAMVYFEVGKAALVESSLGELIVGVGTIYEERIAVLRFINSALVGSLSQANALAPDLAQHALVGRSFSPQPFRVAQYVIKLLGERTVRPTAIIAAEQEPAWVLSTRALLTQDVHGALQWARQHTDQMIGTQTMVGFDAYTLIRAELACCHGEAAMGLLQARNERGTVHYFDDLFLARAHLLLANREKAAEHFAHLHQAVRTYGASGRLEFELRLAPELSTLDLIELSRTLDSVHLKEASAALIPPPRTVERRAVDRLISVAREMQSVKELIVHFADVDVPCLVTGETGTGKELVAQALHESSARRAQPLVEINCGALSDALIESELFGHQRGAFTGAQAAHPGLFREAGAGTIFLDEIGDISPKLQMALLRVLETGEARAVGGSETYKINCRIVAATNADLARRVDEGRFRADLMYRLERLQIHLPPLRDRPDDIIILAEHFLNLRRPEGKIAVLLPRLKARLRDYAWPGNVRELRNVIERMRILNSDKMYYDIDDLDSFRSGNQTALADAAEALRPDASDEAEVLAGGGALALSPGAGAMAKAAKQGRELRSGAEVASYLETANSTLRRLGRLRTLFSEFPQLKVSEVATILDVSRATAARYLEVLSAEGTVKKVCPTASRSSQYYVRNGRIPEQPD